MYYESRINKIPRKYILNSILKTTWLADNSINYCKPIDDDELVQLLNIYSKNKEENIKNKLYNGLVWYAAYVAYFMYKNYSNFYPLTRFDDYLSHCLERLIYRIDDWSDDKSNGATFYTRFFDDIRFSIKSYLFENYGEGLCKRCIIGDASRALARISYKIGSINSAIKLDPEEFKNEFGISKDRFLKYIINREVISGNTMVSPDNAIDSDCKEIFDFVKDEYSSSFVDRVLSSILSDEITELAKKKFKDKNMTYFLIWKDYKTGNYTLVDLADKYYNGKRTRERIRQIINLVDDKIMNNDKYIDIKNAMNL